MITAFAILAGPSAALAQASIDASAAADNAQKELPGAYRQVTPGLLARTLFSTSQAGPVAVEIVDILVGTGKSATIPKIDFAALLEVEAGDAVVKLDDRAVAARQGGIIAVAQGQSITIDNSDAMRSFVARLIRLSIPGN